MHDKKTKHRCFLTLEIILRRKVHVYIDVQMVNSVKHRYWKSRLTMSLKCKLIISSFKALEELFEDLSERFNSRMQSDGKGFLHDTEALLCLQIFFPVRYRTQVSVKPLFVVYVAEQSMFCLKPLHCSWTSEQINCELFGFVSIISFRIILRSPQVFQRSSRFVPTIYLCGRKRFFSLILLPPNNKLL